MYKKILIAMDVSEPSKKAAKRGVELAKEQGATVLGVHILDEDALNIMDAGSEEVNRLKSQQMERGKKALSILEGIAKSMGVKVETVLGRGEPDKEIIKTAHRKNADLIVMGTHGRKGISELLNPNTPEEALEECPKCPIMVVV